MTTTVILFLICLAIGARELYLASDKRLPRAQADLRDLRAKVADLAKRHEALQAQVADTAPVVAPEAEPARPSPETLERVDAIADRVARLEKDFAALASRLEDLDLDRDAQHSLARALDAVEQDIGELHAEMLDRLDRQEGVVPGLLLSEEGEAEPLLAEAFERCAAEYGLRVRIRDQRSAKAPGGAFRGTAYQLSGRRPDALAEELFAYVRAMYDPHDPSALNALLTEMAHLDGGCVARIGPFAAVRTPDALLSALLPPDVEAAGDPWELAAQVRELPEEAQCDLSWLRAGE
ncbi:hypothetical protein [Actinomadura parmotrematis]|uniref:Uncharacterized protein n=1 Tax=Actinomadura parmotrematis TaxID=2864039 RepID=A0ABS7G0T6_9ACTN|nr:hypothetical protein [Actinomadura parmotrematis]MBW8485820.1 hypothetical protein [Actinomadura parmotrematis]